MPAASWGKPYNAGVMLAHAPVLVRRIVRLALLVLHTTAGVVLAALALPILDSRRRDALIVVWSRMVLTVLGVRPAVATAPAVPGGALLVCNHVSWLDIFLIFFGRRVHFVSKSEVRAWPVAGWLAHKTGTLFLERGRRADTLRVNADMAALLRDGAWVAVFPEGTTSDGRILRRFLPSLLQPAVDLNCPIVPAALRYRTLDGDYSAAPAYIDQMSLWQSLLAIVSEPGIVAELHFGAPIPPDGHRRDLAAQAEAATATLLGIAPADTAPQTPLDLPA
jgi:1-acyl-sn-glycerol-3-phosphate acyltransferase